MVNQLSTSFKNLKFFMSCVPKRFSNYKYVNGVSTPDMYRRFLWKAVGGSRAIQARMKKICPFKAMEKSMKIFFFQKEIFLGCRVQKRA